MKRSLFVKIVLLLAAVLLVNCFWGCKDEVTQSRLQMLEQKMMQEKNSSEVESLKAEIADLKKELNQKSQ